MADRLVGVAVGGPTIREIQAMILRAEELGIHAAWMTTGGARPDSITAFAATAGLTERIKLGTSIVPTYPRHPLVMVQQAQIVATLAPGRFRLGVGPSHRPTIEAMGIDFNAPLGHLREYLQILKAILQQGGWTSTASTTRPTTASRSRWTSRSWARRCARGRSSCAAPSRMEPSAGSVPSTTCGTWPCRPCRKERRGPVGRRRRSSPTRRCASTTTPARFGRRSGRR